MTQATQQSPRPGLGTVALVLAAAGLLLAVVPGLGLVLGFLAVGTALFVLRGLPDGATPGRKRARSSLGLGICALVLGGGFTVARASCTPDVDTPGVSQPWPELDRAFESAVAKGAASPQPDEAAPASP